jgi:hypothetical protein
MVIPNLVTAPEVQMPTDEFINSSEAARRLSVTSRTITRWVLDGYFPGAFKVNPHAERSPYLIPVSAVEEFERMRQEGMVEEPDEE